LKEQDMHHSTRYKTNILFAAAAILIATLACTLIPPARPDTPPPPPTTTELPPEVSPTETSIPSVNPEQAAVNQGMTDAAGQAAFQDPLTGGVLTVAAVDSETGSPVGGLQVWFMSLGTEVLILVRDPNRVYAPTIEEVLYDGPGANQTVELLILPYSIITQIQEDWYAYFMIYPDLDRWVVAVEEACSGLPAVQPGMGGGEGADILMANLPVDAALNFSSNDTIPASQGVAEDLLATQAGSPVAEQYLAQSPALIRWENLTLHPEIPTLARPAGFCLEPLDRTDPQDLLAWVQHGLETGNAAVFEILAAEEGVGYANYLEGGQLNTQEEFLEDLALRLPSNASCDGYSFSDPWFQIWTSGWEPDWEITELCYVSCQPLEPPHTSDIGGFFFRPQDNGAWVLQTMWLNDSSLWEEVYGAEILGCEVAVKER
jgi:hypothetical protein